MSPLLRPARDPRLLTWWRQLRGVLVRRAASLSARRVRALAAHHAPHHPTLAAELRAAADRHVEVSVEDTARDACATAAAPRGPRTVVGETAFRPRSSRAAT